MKKITFLMVLAFFTLVIVNGQNAPISTVGDVTSTGTTATVPITAINFTDIGSTNQQLLYDPSVATATSVTLGPGMAGGISTDVATPGVIRFGWYNFPGITLPDNSVIFNITFTKVAGGSTNITWDDTYPDRQWSDGFSNPLNDLPFDQYYFDGSLNFQEDAPITTAPTLTACANTTIDVPITVKDFNTIGSLSLRLSYNETALTYQSFTNNSGFPGLAVFNPIPGTITAAGFSTTVGITLPDDAILFTLHFTFLGGFSDLAWFDDDGSSCEYAGPPFTYLPLNDIPTSTFYINGQISELCQSEWTGDIDSDWFKTGNWTNGVPSVSKDAIIPDVTPNPFPQINNDADCKDADIAADASLTILEDGTLTSSGPFNNDGSFRVKSSSLGDGSFIDNGNISGNGTFTIERYIVSEKWHYVSSPISDGLSGIYYDIYLKEFNEEDSTWFYIVPVDIPLNPMQGYAAWAADIYTGTTIVDYEGTLNTGPLSIGLTNHGGATHNSKGFNFVGNPYPSAVDWEEDAGWTKTNLDASIYLYNPINGQYGSYTYGDPGSGTNDVTNIIPSGQGFFVHVTDGNPTGSLGINNNARLHDPKPFFKDSKSITTENNYLKLKTSSNINAYIDETIIQFKEGATEMYDPQYDAYKFQGRYEAPQLYTVSSDTVNLAFNNLPLLTENKVVPLHFSVITESGIYTIEVLEILNFNSATNVYLEDLKENTCIDLKEQNTYSFYSDPLDEPNRFKIHFISNPVAVSTGLENEHINIYANGNLIYLVNKSNNLLLGDFSVYNSMGQILKSESIDVSYSYVTEIKIGGVYIATFYDTANNNLYRKKLFIK